MSDEELGVGGGEDDDFDAVGGCRKNGKKSVEVGEELVIKNIDGRVADSCSGDCTSDFKRDGSMLAERAVFKRRHFDVGYIGMLDECLLPSADGEMLEDIAS